MLYDIRLELTYHYDAPVLGGRHLVRVTPANVPGAQRVIASALSFEPRPLRETSFIDFYGNIATTLVYDTPHEDLRIRLGARVLVEDTAAPADLSPDPSSLADEIARYWSVEPDSPHHYLGPSPRVQLTPEITAYAAGAAAGSRSVLSAARALADAVHRDFTYEPGATDVGTTPAEAFLLKKGVCQDFAQVMIAGLRGIGIPAGYVSGFLRTNPPPGKPRLEGADALHAWVRVWCGQAVGWVELDPTNRMLAGPDHIAIAYGRDYADVSPIVGVLRTHGSHKASQSVDVVRVE